MTKSTILMVSIFLLPLTAYAQNIIDIECKGQVDYNKNIHQGHNFRYTISKDDPKTLIRSDGSDYKSKYPIVEQRTNDRGELEIHTAESMSWDNSHHYTTLNIIAPNRSHTIATTLRAEVQTLKDGTNILKESFKAELSCENLLMQ